MRSENEVASEEEKNEEQVKAVTEITSNGRGVTTSQKSHHVAKKGRMTRA